MRMYELNATQLILRLVYIVYISPISCSYQIVIISVVVGEVGTRLVHI